MASSWLSRRPHRRKPGGRGRAWRCAGAKGLLQLRVRTRRLCRAVMLRPARTDLGRMALAHSTYRGMLMTRAAFSRNDGKEDWHPAMPGFFDQSATRYVDRHQCPDRTDLDNAP